MYIGWLLPENDRNKLLAVFAPTYERVFAHHVTLTLKKIPLPIETSGRIVGMVDSMGVQAFVVKIGDTIVRPDGKIFHITWSLGEGKKPVHSNDVINKEFIATHDIFVNLTPMMFE